MIVVKWGKTFSLGVDEAGRPQASLTLRGSGNLPGKTVVLVGPTPLTPRRWATLELLADGRGAWLLVDAQVVDRARAEGEPYFRLGEPLFLSAPQAPVAGVVDEVRLQALQAEPPEALPEGVDLKGPDLVRFLPGGALDPSLHPDGVEIRVLLPGGGERTILVTPAGVVQ